MQHFISLPLITVLILLTLPSCNHDDSSTVNKEKIETNNSSSKDEPNSDTLEIISEVILETEIINNATISECNCNILLEHDPNDDEDEFSWGHYLTIHYDDISEEYEIESARIIGYDLENELAIITDVEYVIEMEGSNTLVDANYLMINDTVKTDLYYDLQHYKLSFNSSKLLDTNNDLGKVVIDLVSDPNQAEYFLLNCNGNWIKIETPVNKDTYVEGWISTNPL